MHPSTRTVLAVITVATTLCVTGCGSSDDAATRPSNRTASAPPTGSSTDVEASAPEPSVDPHPPVDALVVSTSGLGPLTIGLPPESNPGAPMIVYRPDECVGMVAGDQGRGPGRWVADYPPYTDSDGNAKPQFWVDVNEESGVYWIDVQDPAIPTTTGIHIGSTLAELQAAYPDLVEGTPGPVSQPWWVSDDAGTLVFEVQDDSQELQPPGTPPIVVLIHVQASGTDPDWTSANSDLVAGGCE